MHALQVHAVCQGGSVNGYSISCERGRTFVEVGCALGHVSMYMASRGMRVVAVDPLEINIDRVKESLCLNGVAACYANFSKSSSKSQSKLSSDGDDGNCWSNTEWGPFGSASFHPVVGLVADAVNKNLTLVESEPHNLAATIKGTTVLPGVGGRPPPR